VSGRSPWLPLLPSSLRSPLFFFSNGPTGVFDRRPQVHGPRSSAPRNAPPLFLFVGGSGGHGLFLAKQTFNPALPCRAWSEEFGHRMEVETSSSPPLPFFLRDFMSRIPPHDHGKHGPPESFGHGSPRSKCTCQKPCKLVGNRHPVRPASSTCICISACAQPASGR